MRSETHAAAKREALSDLERVREQIEALQKDKTALELLVECLTLLEPDQPTLPMDLPPREDYSLPAEVKTLRKSPNGTRKLAIDTLKNAGRPMTVPEIHKHVVSVLGGTAPKRESIRVLMLRNPDTFQQHGEGLYSLKEGYENTLDGDYELQEKEATEVAS